MLQENGTGLWFRFPPHEGHSRRCNSAIGPMLFQRGSMIRIWCRPLGVYALGLDGCRWVAPQQPKRLLPARPGGPALTAVFNADWQVAWIRRSVSGPTGRSHWLLPLVMATYIASRWWARTALSRW